MLKQKYQFKNYNWILISAVLILSGMGVMFINSADSSYTSKQLVGLIFCAGIMLLLSVVNFNFVCGFSRILYLINIVLLVRPETPVVGVVKQMVVGVSRRSVLGRLRGVEVKKDGSRGNCYIPHPVPVRPSRFSSRLNNPITSGEYPNMTVMWNPRTPVDITDVV